MNEIVPSSDKETHAPSEGINFALVLSRMIDSLQQNPAELRATVYELARVKLYEQLGREDVTETKRLVGALEEAIAGVESFSRSEEEKTANDAARGLLDRSNVLLPLTNVPATTGSDTARTAFVTEVVEDPLGSARSISTVDQQRSAFQPRARLQLEPVARKRNVALGLAARFVLVLLVLGAGAAAVVAWPRMRDQIASVRRTLGEKPSIASQGLDKNAASQPARGREDVATAVPRLPLPSQTAATDKPAYPLPTTFGVYAISDNRLSELKALAGKVPDSRVAVSAAISTPSDTVLPDGKVKFIVFRRDGASNAPDRVDVRVVAKVTRAMGVDGAGKAKVTAAQDSWVIRNVTIPYKVGPVEEHPEMFLIQADDADVPLPAGRYAVVVKGQGYDFTVDGAISDPSQCMERIDAVNGTFYSPCPKSGEQR